MTPATSESAMPAGDGGHVEAEEPSEAEIAFALVESEGEAPMTLDADEPADAGEAVTEPQAEELAEDAAVEELPTVAEASAEAVTAEDPAFEAVAEEDSGEGAASVQAEAVEEAETEVVAAELPTDAEASVEAASADEAAATDHAPAADASVTSAAEEDPLIEIWRPAPRRQGPRHHHHHRHQTLPPEGTGRIVWRAREPKPASPRSAPPPQDAEAPGAAERADAPAGHGIRHNQGPGRGERRGGSPFNGPKRDDRKRRSSAGRSAAPQGAAAACCRSGFAFRQTRRSAPSAGKAR